MVPCVPRTPGRTQNVRSVPPAEQCVPRTPGRTHGKSPAKLARDQLAMTAATIWLEHGDTHKDGRPKKDANGKTYLSDTFSVKTLARQFHVSVNSIQQARDLLEQAPDLAERLFSLPEACPVS